MPRLSPLRRFYRHLAQWPKSALGLDFVLVAGIAMGTFHYTAGVRERPAEIIASLTVVVLTSVLFAVITWYRDEVVINASIFLAVAWVGANVCGIWVAALLSFPSRGRGVFGLAIGGLFGIPVAIMEAIVVFGLLVAGGRRLRRYIAPDTLERVMPAGSDGAA